MLALLHVGRNPFEQSDEPTSTILSHHLQNIRMYNDVLSHQVSRCACAELDAIYRALSRLQVYSITEVCVHSFMLLYLLPNLRSMVSDWSCAPRYR